ncbi:hypothetical protein [Halobellus rufus]|uniref:hypothetical protein n=1 Tax=Halobellus rufus TaxID=1448860 RepID=UPI000679B30D|nr:hypothetical protein [Halobellus rufus]
MSDRLRLRRPEHTGENRCGACTAVNVVALAALVVLLGLWRPLLAAAVALVGGVAVWLRGYLFPYTPRFAPRLVTRLPPRLARWFDGHERRSDSLGDVRAGGGGDRADERDGNAVGDGDPLAATTEPTPDEVFEALVSASVVAVDDDRLEPTASFASSWRAEMTSLADLSDAALADAVADGVATAESARVERAGSDVFVVVTGGDGGVTWLRRPVALAEVGAVRALADTGVPDRLRPAAAHALCAFLDACPDCGEELVESAPEDCCGHTLPDLDGAPPAVLACEACGVVFQEFE